MGFEFVIIGLLCLVGLAIIVYSPVTPSKSYIPVKSIGRVALGIGMLLTTGSVHADERDKAPLSKIAFSARQPGRSSIFVVQSNGITEKRLTDGGMDLLPKWSPNGNRIAFLALREPDRALAETNDFAFHWFLYVMDADGTNQRRVSITPIGLIFDWSPEGNSFVFQSSHEDPRNKGKDGLMSSAIYIMNSDGTAERRLTPIEHDDKFPTWSPGGKMIAFCSNRGGNDAVFVMHSDGRGTTRITTAKDMVERPLWSPDGKLIAVSKGRDHDDGGVWLISTGGEQERRISNAGTAVSWSPSGDALLIAQKGGLFVIDQDGRNRLRITDQKVRPLDGVFSPDGSRVFYRAGLEQGVSIFSVKLNGSDRIRLTRWFDGITGFAVSQRVRARSLGTTLNTR